MSSASLGEVFTDSRQVSRFLAKADPLAVLAAELGRPFEDYRRRWDRAKTFIETPPFPLHVDYELKRECDLKCPMCLTGRMENTPGELSLELVKNLIDQGAALGQAAMGFGGLWEPLASPHIPELGAHGRFRGLVDVMFNTNGLRLAPKVSEDLIGAGLTRIMISLDAATEATYRLMRPGSDFGLVVSNIEELLAARARKRRRLPLVRLSFCLTRLNESELPAFKARWENKADFLSIQSYGNFSEKGPNLFPKASPVSPPSGRCAQPFKRLSVLHDGAVTPCCDLSGLKLAIGRVPDLASIWNGDAIKTLRSKLLESGDALPPECRRCQAKFQPSE